MEKLKSLCLSLVLVLGLQTVTTAQNTKSADQLKKHINKMVQKVEAADEPEVKRTIMDDTFSNMIVVFDRLEKIKGVSGSDKSALADFKAEIMEKKDELNGQNGFAKVQNNELNDFANYVQQDLEQAQEYVTISVGVLVLAGLLLLLL